MKEAREAGAKKCDRKQKARKERREAQRSGKQGMQGKVQEGGRSQHSRHADTNLANPRTLAWFMKSLKRDALLGGAELNRRRNALCQGQKDRTVSTGIKGEITHMGAYI
eukprot:1161899-Pelagomonas_calceolata.AAC.3